MADDYKAIRRRLMETLDLNDESSSYRDTTKMLAPVPWIESQYNEYGYFPKSPNVYATERKNFGRAMSPSQIDSTFMLKRLLPEPYKSFYANQDYDVARSTPLRRAMPSPMSVAKEKAMRERLRLLMVLLNLHKGGI